VASELEELEPTLWLSCSISLAPCELEESDASWVRAELAAEESPALRAWTMALMSFAVSADSVDFAEVVADDADAALRAVESRESRSCCAPERLPFSRSEPSWFNSLTKALELVDEDAMFERTLPVMPLLEVVAEDAVAPFSASCERVTKSSCAADRLPLCTSLANWLRSVRNEFSVEGELTICDKRLLVIPLVAKGEAPSEDAYGQLIGGSWSKL
jgi:hypothetical protein